MVERMVSIVGKAAHVDVWAWELDQPGWVHAALDPVLSADEHARAARFLKPTDQQRFRIAHGGLRWHLARAMGCDAPSIQFERHAHGKPIVVGAQGVPPVQFNLSHTGRGARAMAALAICKTHAVGIDIEGIAHVGTDVSRGFTAQERSLLRDAGDDATWRARFFAIWTAKEAALKAVGLGLSAGLDAVCVAGVVANAGPGHRNGHRALICGAKLKKRYADGEIQIYPIGIGDGFSAAVGIVGAETLSISVKIWRPKDALRQSVD